MWYRGWLPTRRPSCPRFALGGGTSSSGEFSHIVTTSQRPSAIVRRHNKPQRSSRSRSRSRSRPRTAAVGKRELTLSSCWSRREASTAAVAVPTEARYARPQQTHTLKTLVDRSSIHPDYIVLSLSLSFPFLLLSPSVPTCALTTKSPAIKAVEPGCAQQFFSWVSWVPVSTSTTVASPSPADDVSSATSLIRLVPVGLW